MRTFKEKETGRIFTEDEYRKFWKEESADPDNRYYGASFEDYVYGQCHEKNCPDREVII